MRAATRVAALAHLGLLCGCLGSAGLSSELVAVERELQRAVTSGAYYCAPRELALSRAHLSFAQTDRAQGEPVEARRQLREASLNARAALRLSPSSRCAGSAAAVPQEQAAQAMQDAPDPDRDGIAGDADQCPGDPEDLDAFQDLDGCSDADNDLDGRPDAADACPLEPEDADGQDDADGCPDVDADADGVQDGVDDCPDRPGLAAYKGCPRVRYRGVELTTTAVRLLEPIYFDDGAATIRSVSSPVLDAIVELLREHPEVTVEVQGHTDSQGDAKANLTLSAARADAVVRHLADRGIEASRLTPKGYGETRPMESNRTSQGRAINRRIELVRTDGAAP